MKRQSRGVLFFAFATDMYTRARVCVCVRVCKRFEEKRWTEVKPRFISCTTYPDTCSSDRSSTLVCSQSAGRLSQAPPSSISCVKKNKKITLQNGSRKDRKAPYAWSSHSTLLQASWQVAYTISGAMYSHEEPRGRKSEETWWEA